MYFSFSQFFVVPQKGFPNGKKTFIKPFSGTSKKGENKNPH